MRARRPTTTTYSQLICSGETSGVREVFYIPDARISPRVRRALQQADGGTLRGGAAELTRAESDALVIVVAAIGVLRGADPSSFMVRRAAQWRMLVEMKRELLAVCGRNVFAAQTDDAGDPLDDGPPGPLLDLRKAPRGATLTAVYHLRT